MERKILPLLIALSFLFPSTPACGGSSEGIGVLVLAHGGSPAWNRAVLQACRPLESHYPTEVAFGMSDPKTIEPAVGKLLKRGVGKIVAVPFLISSHSEIIGDSRYVLGLADHPASTPPSAKGKGKHQHKLHPISIPVPVVFRGALDRSPEVGEVLLERAREMSRKPEQEIVVLVAHGPVSTEDEQKWLADLKYLADPLRRAGGFRRVEAATLRDDAPAPIRDRATRDLRRLVKSCSQEAACLVVPVLLASGGIEKKIPTRLKGLRFRFTGKTLLPHPEMEAWLLRSVREALRDS